MIHNPPRGDADAALEAAAEAFHCSHCPIAGCHHPLTADRTGAQAALKAAAPLIAAAERERIRHDVQAQFTPPRGQGAFADGWHSAVDELLDLLADPAHKLAPFADLFTVPEGGADDRR